MSKFIDVTHDNNVCPNLSVIAYDSTRGPQMIAKLIREDVLRKDVDAINDVNREILPPEDRPPE